MSPVLDPSSRQESSNSLKQTTAKPSANDQRAQNGQSPITHEPDPNASREKLVKENQDQFQKQKQGDAKEGQKQPQQDVDGKAEKKDDQAGKDDSNKQSEQQQPQQSENQQQGVMQRPDASDDEGEDKDIEDPRVRHPSTKKLDPKGEGYSLRDVPRLHFMDHQHQSIKYWPASAPRIILDATEDEFHKQAKPKPKPPQKKDDEKESHKKPAGGDGEEGQGKNDEKQKATKGDGGEKEKGGEGKDEKGVEDKEEGKEAKGDEGKDKEQEAKGEEKAKPKEEEGKDEKPKEEKKEGEGKDGESKEGDKAEKKEGGDEKKEGDEDKKEGGEEKDEKKDLGPPNPLYMREWKHIHSLQTDPGTEKSSPAYLRALTIEIDDRDRNTPDNWVPRRTDLIRNTGSHPMNAEPQLTELMRYGLVTPNMVHYIRNHGPVPFLEWDTHKLEITGMVDKPLELSMDELASMPWINIPVTMACDGNRRGEVNMVKRSTGFTWGAGALSTSYWKGVTIRHLLELAVVKEGAKFVCFEGSDHLANGAYGTSLTLSYCMEEKNDAMIAFEMNGRALPPDHGYPIRTILPGCIGGRTVKWLKKIIVSDQESTSWYHWHDNRFIPPHVTNKDEAERDKWWYTPDTLLMAGPLQSVITKPAHGERLPIANISSAGQQEVEVAGYAYCGGGRKVSMVQISLDGGETWTYAPRKFLDQACRWDGERWWTWCHWSVNVPALSLLSAKEIMVRAYDSAHQTQPMEISWNLGGFQNNSVYRVKSSIQPADESAGGPYIEFVHPIAHPDAEVKGWMKPSVEDQIESAKADSGTPEKTFSWEEIGKHTSEKDCWVVFGGKVYDVTKFLSKHPGGPKPLLTNAGKDATSEFESIHDDTAKKMAAEYCIGKVDPNESGPGAEKGRRAEKGEEELGYKISLKRDRWIPCRLVKKDIISHDTRRFTFKVPYENTKLGLPVGKHIRVGAHFKDKMVVRPYTPTRPIVPEEDDGTFDLVVKIYFPHSDPYYPPGGCLSNYLDTMEEGDAIDVKGPEGMIEYDGNGDFNIEGEDKHFKRVMMVAGGTGITPIYQVIHAIAKNPKDKTEIALIYANKTVDDILLKEEFDALAKDHEGQFKLKYSIDKAPEKEEDQKEAEGMHVGHVDEGVMKEVFGDVDRETLALVCGPPAMMEKAIMPALKKIGFDEDWNLYSF
ncbi:hypothetical protein HDV00_011162 [Rhizophlyctis rosea]|nr:hypothetical protein HDV00_011162 [Rhizophlyctis rosea]